MNKKVLLSVALAAVVLILVGIGFVAYSKLNSPQATFNNFLKTQAESKQAALGSVYEGQGTNIKNSVLIDSVSKQVVSRRTLSCEATYKGNIIKAKASFYSVGSTSYFRLDDISGTVINQPPIGPKDTAVVFSKIKGQWYKANKPLDEVQAMQDSGAFVFDTGVVAPMTDSAKIVKAFDSNQVFKILSSAQTEKGTNFKVTVSRSQYSKMLTSTFPDLKNVDSILGNIFGKEDQKTISIYDITNEGKYSSASSETENICISIYQTFPLIKVDGLPAIVQGVSMPIDPSEVQELDLTNSKPESTIFTQLVL